MEAIIKKLLEKDYIVLATRQNQKLFEIIETPNIVEKTKENIIKTFTNKKEAKVYFEKCKDIIIKNSYKEYFAIDSSWVFGYKIVFEKIDKNANK
jgi:hypothetical protein